jgi:iron complex transport system substrate-binding protein
MKTNILAGTAMSLLLLLVLPAAASSDYTLGIFGNANEDDTINMQDVTYTELIILEYREQTELSDAKHDGNIDILDMTQIALIILGKEKELTILDDTGEAVTISKPVESFVYHGHNSYIYETLRAIDVADRIVGVSDRFTNPTGYRYSKAYFPELCNLTNVGIITAPDYEVINNLRPDIVITDNEEYYDRTKTPGIPLIANDVMLSNFREATMKYGYIFDKVEEAEAYIDWYDGWEKTINEKTETLSEDEKPLVYIGSYTPGTTSFQVPARDNYRAVMVRGAGGDYIGDEIDGTDIINVDAEWVIDRNPDIVIFSAGNQYLGYDIEDPSEVIALIDDFRSRPDFKEVNAVKNNQVYVVSHSFILCGGASGLIGTIYYAKWMYTDLFADMDTQAMHQEFVTNFQHLDLDMEDCICVYPPPT